jgi:hypothetical protein
MGAYLRHGKVVHPKDITQNGHLAVDFGKGDIVEFPSVSLEIRDTECPGLEFNPKATERCIIGSTALPALPSKEKREETEYENAKKFLDSHFIVAKVPDYITIAPEDSVVLQKVAESYAQKVKEVVAEKQATWRQVRYIQVLTGRMYKTYELSRDEASAIITDVLKSKKVTA